METIKIGSTTLLVKDYHCATVGEGFRPYVDDLDDPFLKSEYLKKEKPALWLYVNVTDQCNAGCPFCVSGATCQKKNKVDPEKFGKMLEVVKPHIYGISFTGGESMLDSELLNQLVLTTDEIVGSDIEIDLATNGTNLKKLAKLPCIDRINAIHISRHHYDDQKNQELMNFKSPSAAEIKDFLSSISVPQKVVLNCVLQKGGIKNNKDVARYLDFAIETGISNTSFIGMFKANDYCKDNYILPNDLVKDYHEGNTLGFTVWNRHSDYEYCHCLTGSYQNQKGHTRFYFRCPGNEVAPTYCRQLVYTADNILQDGFGNGRTQIMNNYRFITISILLDKLAEVRDYVKTLQQFIRKWFTHQAESRMQADIRQSSSAAYRTK